MINLGRRPQRRTLLIIAAAVVLTVVAVLVAVNFLGNEKKIERHVERLYSLEDPRFQHAMALRW